MGLSRENVTYLEDAGFTKHEIKTFASAKTVSGAPMDINTIFRSIPFAAMVESRKSWWRTALAPKSLGGMGLTNDEAYDLLDNFYKQRQSKTRKDFWSFLKAEYRPPSRIKNERVFRLAIENKAIIARNLGVYSTPIKQKGERVMCSQCQGSGQLRNIEGNMTTCLHCGGSGRLQRRR